MASEIASINVLITCTLCTPAGSGADGAGGLCPNCHGWGSKQAWIPQALAQAWVAGNPLASVNWPAANSQPTS